MDGSCSLAGSASNKFTDEFNEAMDVSSIGYKRTHLVAGSGSNKREKTQESDEQCVYPDVTMLEKKPFIDGKIYDRPRGIAGIRLAEILSIIINPDVEECEIYGSISVEDDKGIVDNLLNLKSEDAEPISNDPSSDQRLPISHTNRAIRANEYFTVNFDLKDGDNSQFLKESFSWNAENDEDYDKPLLETIVGSRGTLTMAYIVHRLAIEVHIGAKLVNMETACSSLDFQGTIVARYKNRRYDVDASDDLREYSRVNIFEGRVLKMFNNEPIPLDYTVVAMPLYVPLVIEVDMEKYVEDENEDEGGQVLWHGEVEFYSDEIVEQYVDKYVEGPSGCIKVRLRGINYAKAPFAEMERRKDSLRKYGALPPTWPYDDDKSLV